MSKNEPEPIKEEKKGKRPIDAQKPLQSPITPKSGIPDPVSSHNEPLPLREDRTAMNDVPLREMPQSDLERGVEPEAGHESNASFKDMGASEPVQRTIVPLEKIAPPLPVPPEPAVNQRDIGTWQTEKPTGKSKLLEQEEEAKRHSEQPVE